MPRLALVALVLTPTTAVAADFDRDVRPIFVKACFSCHGPDKQRGGLRLDRKADALSGGDSGKVILPGKAAESLLLKLVSGDPDRPMPPKGEKLSPPEVAILKAWIDRGANWPATAGDTPGEQWWSLKPLVKPAVPGTHLQSQIANPIDAFVRAKLTEKGLKPSPEADRRTLIRRLSFDLTGLPPTPEEIEAFVADPSPTAYEQSVDRLLASPAYGERWARHWLDVVHYGDTHGYDKDQPRPNAWPYRDYVIRSLNADKPYSRFVREQLAGDVLYPGTVDGVTALGFIAAGPWDFIGHAEVPETKTDGLIARHLDRDDMVGTAMNTFVGLTVQCAQCHHHKFDPIRQDDYYRLQAVFAALDRADRPFHAEPAAATKHRQLTDRRAKLMASRQRLVVPASVAGSAILAVEIATVETELATVRPTGTVYAGTIHTGSGTFRGTGPEGKPRTIRVLRRGDVRSPADEVGPGSLTLGTLPGTFAPTPTEGDRRAELAKWVTDPRNPLTWRVIVNRVWQYHFGRGIVATANDFGRMGQLPTHPELLDWLAAEFRDGGQSLKTLHKLIVTSATYKQTSAGDPAAERVDAGNAYLWRMTRRKLEAEAVRDAALAVSGKLDRTMYGPPFRDFVVRHPEHSPHYEYHLFDPADPAAYRRSVYRFLVRSKPQPFMTVLDCADPSMQVDKRNETLSPLQALALFNNAFMLTAANHLAARVEKDADPVASAFRRALGRSPTAAERASLAAYAKGHGLANACRVVLNLNEFVFVD